MEPIIETVLGADGTPIITARFTPSEAPLGTVLMVHGFGEHHGGYLRLGEFFCRNGFAAVTYDQRGFGRNYKNSQGVLAGYDLFLDDITAMRQAAGEWFPDVPVYLFGHSMGGNIAVNYMLKRETEDTRHIESETVNGNVGFKKLILETPWLRLYTPMPALTVLAARIIGRISYKPAVSAKLVLDEVTRDKASVDEASNDEFRHNRLSLRIFTQITDAGEYALTNAKKLKIPTLLICAGNDKIVSPDAIREFARAADDNVLFYEEKDGYHALHNDTEPVRGRVLDKILGFINNKA